MIARITGKLVEKAPDHVVIDVGGVGYQILISLNTFYHIPPVGKDVHLHIYTHVREDALQLFGFVDRAEKDLFLLLKGVAGIGPRLSLNILSGMPVRELEHALGEGNLHRLLSIPGVGRKTAERLVVELREKIPAVRDGRGEMTGEEGRTVAEATSALVNLGYRKGEAEKAVRESVGEGRHDLEEVIRVALGRLSG